MVVLTIFILEKENIAFFQWFCLINFHLDLKMTLI